MHRSNSATTRRCAASRSQSAVSPASAASSPPRATKRVCSVCIRRCRWRSAVRLCPALLIVRPDFSRYKAASDAVFRLFREVTPLVEPLSLDEAYLDVTENLWGESFGTTVAQRLKQRIREETQADRVGGRRTEQVPREDRIGVEEAGRLDGDRVRTASSRSCSSCRWTRCGASVR